MQQLFIRSHVIARVMQVFGILLAGSCLAGPPLTIDDPGILETGAWEVILGYSIDKRQAIKVTDMPSLDVSLGVSPNSQVSVFIPRTTVQTELSGRESGLGFASVGYKWRFASTPAWEWALAANYDFLVSHELFPVDGPDDIKILSIPLLASFKKQDWVFNGQLAWESITDGSRFWNYGLSVSHPMGSAVQLMAEISGISNSSFDTHELNYQLGVDVMITPAFHLLGSAGSRIRSDLDPALRLDYSLYVGLQWFSGN